MAKSINIKLSSRSIQAAVDELNAYKESIDKKLDLLCRRLAEMGAVKVSLGYARAIYSGDKDISVTVEQIPDGYAIVASGESVLFVEFGAGARYGDGHPLAGEYGMGPGTYPNGKGHWNDPRGWYIPKEHGGGHTYGNPPSAVMYETAKELRAAVLDVAREVFAAD